MSYTVLKEVVLEPRHLPTGKTRHIVYGRPIPRVAVLRIAQMPGEEGFYLLYFDAQGHELTDTFHETVEDAILQAEWEFGVKKGDWRTIPGNN